MNFARSFNELHAFFISNPRLKLAKKLSNTLRLKFRHLKIIYFLHSRYQPILMGDVLKM